MGIEDGSAYSKGETRQSSALRWERKHKEDRQRVADLIRGASKPVSFQDILDETGLKKSFLQEILDNLHGDGIIPRSGSESSGYSYRRPTSIDLSK